LLVRIVYAIIIFTMAVPKKKTSRSVRNQRRSHDKLEISMGVNCKNCNSYKQNHTMCETCGFHKGVLIKAPKIKQQ
jgi:large subunit ribosomal protein L32